jgi:hypothetical protein
MALKAMGVAVPTALVGATVLEVPRAAALTGAPASVYSVKNDGGMSSNGLYDDQSLQRCLDAAALNYGGTIVVDCRVIFGPGSVAVRLPAKGTYSIQGIGSAASCYAVNEGYPPGLPVPGIQTQGDTIGGQSRDMAATGLQYLFDGSQASDREFTLRCDDVMFYALNASGNQTVFWLSNSTESFECNACRFQGMGIVRVAGGVGQITRMNVRGNLGSGGPGAVWFDWGAPFGGDISGNVWGEGPLGVGQYGTFIQTAGYWTFMVHHNFLFGQVVSSPVRAWIWADGIAETNDGFIDHNCFYGAASRCIYWRDNYGSAMSRHLTGGLVIDSNQFVGWNSCNIPGDNGSAVVIDHSTGVSPIEQIVTIGRNTWVGGKQNDDNNYAKRGLEIADNPDTASVIFDREQNMRYITVAPYRINGVDYGAPGSSHRFHAVLSPPAIPSSGQPLSNPFGLDCTVYVSGRNVNDVAIEGVSTGLKSGMFLVPRRATITLTYSSVPTWKWFAS